MSTSTKSRKWLYIAGGLVALLVLSRLTSNKTEATPTDNKANRDKALAAILKEPKVKDAAITEANVLYAQVIDDKTRRDGYAMYLCQVLNENQAGVDKVKVVAVGSQNRPDKDNAYGKLLGECSCADYKAGQ